MGVFLRIRSARQTLYLVLASLLLIMGIHFLLGFYGYHWLQDLRAFEVYENDQISEKLKLITTMQTTSRERAITLTLMVNLEDPFARDEQYMRFLQLGAEFAAARDQFLQLGLSPQEQEIILKQNEAVENAFEAHEQLLSALLRDDLLLAQKLLTENSIPRQRKVFHTLGEISAVLEQKSLVSQREISARYSYFYSVFLLIFVVVSVLSGGLVGLYLVKRLSDAQYQVEREKNRFQRTSNGSNDGIWELNTVSGEFYCSPRWLDILGYSRGELPGDLTCWLNLVHADDRQNVVNAIDSHRNGEAQAIDIEHRLRNKQGGWLWCRARGLAETDDSSGVLFLSGSLTDVSERKAAELEQKKRIDLQIEQQHALMEFGKIDCRKTEELRNAMVAVSERCAKITDSDRVGVWFYDEPAAGIVSMDQFDAEKALHDYGEFLPEKDHPEFFDSIRSNPVSAMNNVDDRSGNHASIPKYFTANGLCSLLCASIRSGDELIGFVFFEIWSEKHSWQQDDIVFASSVSDLVARAVEACRRHKAEDNLQLMNLQLEERVEMRTQELEEKNIALDAALSQAKDASRMKSDFLANMSHEIRTPMNGVLGMLDVLRGTTLSTHQLDLVATAYSSGEMLLHLLNDILDLSKIEAGKLELEHTDFDLREKLESVVGLLAQPAHSKGLEIAAILPPDVPAWVNGDPTRLRQILTNLVANAIKFTEQGEVVVTASLEQVRNEELWIRFLVRDTGIGISEDSQKHIFDIFSQADGSTTRRYGGTGLGLAISRHLCELMGGSIGVESSPGKGSTFWFQICLNKPVNPAPQLMDVSTLYGLNALIVDDNPVNCRILEYSLQAWGVNCVSEVDPERALKRLKSEHQHFDVLLLDMMMPRLSGQQLASRIHKEIKPKKLRMIMLTSVTFNGCRGVGDIDACLNKPIRQSTLYNTLLSLFSSAPMDDEYPQMGIEEPDTRMAKLLVVEDHPVNQKVAKGLLQQFGYQVEIAENGRIALQNAKENEYSLILMDCQMPEMDGYEATMKLRSQGNQLPIIAMTANAMKGDEARCINAGMNDYISKPLKPDALRQIIEKWIGASQISAIKESPASAHVASELLDAETVRALTAALGDGLLPLYEEFFSLIPQDLQELSKLCAVEDIAGIRRLSHRIKGGSGNIGLLRVSALGRALERVDPDKESLVHIQELIDKLGDAVSEAQQAIANGALDRMRQDYPDVF